mgnify:CR=1 FL=1
MDDSCFLNNNYFSIMCVLCVSSVCGGGGDGEINNNKIGSE